MIGYLLKKFPRLSETFVLNELLQQEALGSKLHIFSRRTPDDEPRHPQLKDLRAEIEQVPAASGSDPWRELFLHEDLDGLSLDRFARVVRDVLEFEHPRLHNVAIRGPFCWLLTLARWPVSSRLKRNPFFVSIC